MMSDTLVRASSKQLMLFAADSPVRTSAAPAKELALQVLEAAYGFNTSGSWRSCIRGGSWSKMSPVERVRGLTLWSKGWNSSDTRAYRSRLRRRMLALRMNGRGLFIVAAHADTQGQSARAQHAEVGGASSTATKSAHAGWGATQPDMVRVVHGISRGLDRPSARIQALGNAVVPGCAEVIGHLIRELSKP